MSASRLLMWIVLPFMAAAQAHAQGFAGLGTDAEGFALPDPNYRITFPKDHGPHPEFRIEWWYVTAVLSGEDGKDYGAQWTLFRVGLAPRTAKGWDSPQVWIGNAGLTTPSSHYFAERFARDGIGQAGVQAEPFEAWIDEWALSGPSPTAMTMTAQGKEFGYTLDLSATGPFVLQGNKGYSVKSREGTASHYYSQPFYDVAGTLHLPGRDVSVTGSAWLDREWSSQPLSEEQTGWDWFSLAFRDGSRMMGFQLRGRSGEPFTAATWIAADGTTTAFEPGAFRAEPLRSQDVAGRQIPVAWRVSLAEIGVDVTVEAQNPDAWMGTAFPYWEGPVRVTGTHEGRGYLEMTGYEPD